MSNNDSNYKSYLLRLFRTDPNTPWRATLATITGAEEPHHFVDLESMVAYLLTELESSGAALEAASNQTEPEAKNDLHI